MLTAVVCDIHLEQLFGRIQQLHSLLAEAGIPYRIVGEWLYSFMSTNAILILDKADHTTSHLVQQDAEKVTRQAEGLLYMARKRLILRCRAGATRGEAPWSGLSWIRSAVVCARGHACASAFG
jgi:hypothetical protein